jgi:hypothetical protein
MLHLALSNREVILTAGSIDTPKLLLLSGIGPAAELAALDIKVVQDLPGVGKNFQDHVIINMTCQVSSDMSTRWSYESSPAKQEAARKEWTENKTGPLNEIYTNAGVVWLKLPSLPATPEFQSLDAKTQAFLNQETVPHFEIIAVSFLSLSPCHPTPLPPPISPPLKSKLNRLLPQQGRLQLPRPQPRLRPRRLPKHHSNSPQPPIPRHHHPCLLQPRRSPRHIPKSHVSPFRSPRLDRRHPGRDALSGGAKS